MPKKVRASIVPKPRACLQCNGAKFIYGGKHSEGLGVSSLNGFLWECKNCHRQHFVEKPKPKPKKK